MIKLSLIVPCYNEQENVKNFFAKCKEAFKSCKEYLYEVIFIDDGSTDKTWKRLNEIYAVNENVLLISFSRNFGKEAAIYAGLKAATGDLIAIIDADLQQMPGQVLKMADFLLENEEYDVVAMFQEERAENGFICAAKKMFYKVAEKLFRKNFRAGASDFRTFRKYVKDAILEITEHHRFSKGIFSWIGFNTFYMPYTAEKRLNGKTAWSFSALFKYAVEGIVSFSAFPLRLPIWFGTLAIAAAFLGFLLKILGKCFWGNCFFGLSPVFFMILIVGGLNMLSIGLIAEYILQIFTESKRRPIYIMKRFLPKKGTFNEKNK